MEELEPGSQRLSDPILIDPILLSYDRDIVVAHYRGLERLEEEFARKETGRKAMKSARRISYFMIPALSLYFLS